MSFSTRVIAIINARVSVPTWIMLGMNLIIGLIILLLAIFDPVQLGEFGTVLPFGGILLGAMLTGGSILTGWGLSRNSVRWTKVFSALSLATWVFAAVSFMAVPGGGYNVLAFVLPFIFFFVYVYLAAVFRTKLLT